jgi:hypothetical protein
VMVVLLQTSERRICRVLGVGRSSLRPLPSDARSAAGVPVVLRNVLDAFPKDAAIVRPPTIEAVVLPLIATSDWSAENLDAKIEAIRNRYLEILHQD